MKSKRTNTGRQVIAIASILISSIVITFHNSFALAYSAQGKAKAKLDVKTLPSFTRVLLLEQSAETSANVSAGDLNGDGFPDLVLAKGRHWPLIDRVFLNDGHGRFPVAHNLGDIADRSYSVTLADIDQDADLDVVVGNDAPDPKRVYANDGKANFHLVSTFGRPEWPTRNATVADVNNDGLPDIIVANRPEDTTGSNYVCFNKGKGQFDANCLAFSPESATTITPADVNGDGFVDLIVPHRERGQSYVYINDGKSGFVRKIPFGPNDAAIRVSGAADFNRDGTIDIVFIDERRGAFICFGLRGIRFSQMVAISSRSGSTRVIPYALTVGDLNNDGIIDVVVGNIEAQAITYFNDGTGRSFTPVKFGDNKGTVYGFAIADLDRDGLQDIAAARSEAPNVVYFAVANF